MDSNELLWAPSAPQSTQMHHFCQKIVSKYSLLLTQDCLQTQSQQMYNAVYQWSIANIGLFWGEIYADLQGRETILDRKYVVDESLLVDSIPQWFSGEHFNYAQTMLARGKPGHLALVCESEDGKATISMTFAELKRQTLVVACHLRRLGVISGDVVGAWAGNVPAVIVFALAAASIGAIFTTIPPDFGVEAARDRLLQTKPKFLLAPHTVFYNGRSHDHGAKVVSLLGQVKFIPVALSDSGESVLSKEATVIHWEDLCNGGEQEAVEQWEMLPFGHPLYILYSSGTTGTPKCIVHGAGGTLLQHWKEHVLHGDLRPGDVMLQYTTIGWMMWHWMLSALAVGATLVLYEGSPFRPTHTSLLDHVRHHKVTHFGTSAKYIQHLQQLSRDGKLVTDLQLPSPLRFLYSTGSSLGVSSFRFVYQNISSSLMLASITGGTDIISLFAGGNPVRNVYAGEIQGACLGMAIGSDSNGELVCHRPFPSMPVAFWGDDKDHSAYKKAYMTKSPGVWLHGDYVYFNPHTQGGLVMLGRSDGVLNPAGVRFGSAELYSVIDSHFSSIVSDSLAVGVRRKSPSGIDDDESVVLFIVLSASSLSCTASTTTPLSTASNVSLRSDNTLSSDHVPCNYSTKDGDTFKDLTLQIKNCIRASLSPRHVPALILPVDAIPYTLNGKKMEVAVKRILNGNYSDSEHAISNPESLIYYRNLDIHSLL